MFISFSKVFYFANLNKLNISVPYWLVANITDYYFFLFFALDMHYEIQNTQLYITVQKFGVTFFFFFLSKTQ